MGGIPIAGWVHSGKNMKKSQSKVDENWYRGSPMTQETSKENNIQQPQPRVLGFRHEDFVSDPVGETCVA